MQEKKNKDNQQTEEKKNSCGCTTETPLMKLVIFICFVVGAIIGLIFKSSWIAIIAIILLTGICHYIYQSRKHV